jgi:hypothetical protein
VVAAQECCAVDYIIHTLVSHPPAPRRQRCTLSTLSVQRYFGTSGATVYLWQRNQSVLTKAVRTPHREGRSTVCVASWQDGTAALLNSNKWFPSRENIPGKHRRRMHAVLMRRPCCIVQSHGTLFLCSDPAADAASSLKYYQSIARRLYRIFAHAYFHHREMFLEVRSQCFSCFRCLGQA